MTHAINAGIERAFAVGAFSNFRVPAFFGSVNALRRTRNPERIRKRSTECNQRRLLGRDVPCQIAVEEPNERRGEAVAALDRGS